GEIDERPKPAPRITRINDKPAAPAAPARIAPQETPLALVDEVRVAVLSPLSSVEICILNLLQCRWVDEIYFHRKHKFGHQKDLYVHTPIFFGCTLVNKTEQNFDDIFGGKNAAKFLDTRMHCVYPL